MTATSQGTPPAASHKPPAPLGRQRSVELLLDGTHRGVVPIRRDFAQRGHGRTTVPGPLHTFLSSHDERGLEAYLFAHAMAAVHPWDVRLSADAWVRVLGIAETANPESARSAVSKVLRRLEDRRLIVRSRRSRTAVVTLLRECGTGEPFERPLGRTRDDRWLQLPHAYWTEGYYLHLTLPAKVVLLIALTRPDGFALPERMAQDWYGVSPDSLGDGLRELLGKGLLHRDIKWIEAKRSPTGWTQEHHYTLLGPFSSEARKKAAKSRHTPQTTTDAAGETDALLLDLQDQP